ncbi:tRNA (guanine-N(7)-)-methyltransferase non-catalytic subunit trm82 [Xylographa trunciseda]|nr:tRNA (guanine-N(7)-)-methyltransferase non-catalytic subunit trm82 [Xylographa trunciseda]
MVNSNGKHIVAVTGEDKCIRVLEVLADDTMHQISERHMPKRPCSVMFTTDESMILCADKFGDVYALPLFEQYVDKKDGMNEQPMALDQPKEEAKSKSFVPAATALTVHTKRNQQALKHQQSVKSKTSEKKSLNFAHQLLLGHVSLLTDLAYVSVCVGESTSSSTRSYLLTSDRDEHIRISRGLPQAHIIEGYCLGHTEFVSKLCIPPWDSSFLVSGGGDDYLLVWKWLSSEVQQRVELKSLVAIFGKRIRQEPRGGIEQSTIAAGTGSIAVTGIWAIRTPISENEKYEGFIIVACERVPAFFVYSWHENGKVEHHETLEVEGNILDVAVLQTQMAILYTIDSQEHYSPATDEQLRHHLPCLGSYCYLSATRSWVRDSPIQESVDGINEWAAMQEINAPDRGFQNSLMHEYLYGTEKLRKRGQDED